MILSDVAQGIDPKAAKRSSITLKDFIEKEYAPWVEVHRKSGSDAVQRIRRCFFGLFGNKPLVEIATLAVEGWRTRRIKQGRSRETINRDIATFKSALSKAVKWSFIENHPLSKLELLKVDSSAKVRFLTKDEEARLRAALDEREIEMKVARERGNLWREQRGYAKYPEFGLNDFADYLKPMVLLSINTGLRRGELFDLTWACVDLEGLTLTVVGEVAKSGKTRHVPLNREALQALIIWKAQHKRLQENELVFSGKDGKRLNNIKKAWENLLNRAEIENFRWHDMRHHFASRLVMAGVDLNTVRELLGHSDLKMTLRYAHLAPEHKANAVAKLLDSIS